MRNKVLQLVASSPEELKFELENIPHIKGCYANLSISGPKVVVRQVELPLFSRRDLSNAIKLEAAELLTLPPDEVEFEYQILNRSAENISCIFVAVSEDQLDQYYEEILKAGGMPLAVSSQMLNDIDSSLSLVPAGTESFSLISFYKEGTAYLILFAAGKCQLLREINYENLSEAQKEISQSLKYVLSKSEKKETPGFYFTGETKGKNELIAKLEAEFNVKSKVMDAEAGSGPAGIFKLDLLRKYSIGLFWRRNLHLMTNALLAVVLIGFVLLSAEYLKLSQKAYALKADFDPAKVSQEYTQKINDLNHKIQLLENEK